MFRPIYYPTPVWRTYLMLYMYKIFIKVFFKLQITASWCLIINLEGKLPFVTYFQDISVTRFLFLEHIIIKRRDMVYKFLIQKSLHAQGKFKSKGTALFIASFFPNIFTNLYKNSLFTSKERGNSVVDCSSQYVLFLDSDVWFFTNLIRMSYWDIRHSVRPSVDFSHFNLLGSCRVNVLIALW